MADTSNARSSQRATYQQHAYKGSNHSNYTSYAGMSGANTPTNVSPTSPRGAHLHHYPNINNAPQLRRPMNPGYVPAALRRTETPQKQSPPQVDSAMDTPYGSWGSGIGCGPAAGRQTITRIATNDLSSIHSDEPFSPVTGPVTRNHWQSDASTPVCSAPDCDVAFNFYKRRHHCRKCGSIFCGQHSQRQVKLNEEALFHPDGDLQRACDRCFNHYTTWEERLRTRQRQNSDTSSNKTAVPVETPVSKRPDAHVGSVANSFSVEEPEEEQGFIWTTF